MGMRPRNDAGPRILDGARDGPLRVQSRARTSPVSHKGRVRGGRSRGPIAWGCDPGTTRARGFWMEHVMDLCGFKAGLEHPLFLIRGAFVEGGAGAPLHGDATLERRGPADSG